MLSEAGLVAAERAGRHRYYAITTGDVARAIEALQAIAPGIPVRSLKQDRIGEALRTGRTCYDHLAGDLGLRVTDLLVREGVLAPLRVGEPAEPADPLPRSETVRSWLLTEIHARTRPWARGCLDWSGRRPHVAGAIGAHLLGLFEREGWIVRRTGTRAVRLTGSGSHMLHALEESVTS
ncbi:hypothetical protein GCM10027298_26030 [Epidermidibacterium keratini]